MIKKQSNWKSNWYSKKDPDGIHTAWAKIPEVHEFKKGLLLDGYWDTDLTGFWLVFYDIVVNDIVKYLDSSFPPTIQVKGSYDNCHIETQFDALREQEVNVSYIPLKNTWSNQSKQSYEKGAARNTKAAREMRYFHRKRVKPGVFYSLEDNQLSPFSSKLSDDEMNEIKRRLRGEYNDIIELALDNIPFLNAEVPKIRRVAFDIEVSSPRNKFPTPDLASYPVHAIGVYDNEDNSYIFLLGINPSKNDEIDAFVEVGYQSEIRCFLDERDLLKSFFELIQNYAIVLSYNGDNFDMPYLLNRSKKLGIDAPISKGHYRGKRDEFHFYNSIHLDLFRFFGNQAVRLYAFSAKYDRLGLTDVAEGLLGQKKVEHDLWFDEMSAREMIIYTITDVKLTLELTRFQDDLTIRLMFILMRVGAMTITYLNRETISKWILNWIIDEHARRGYLLPARKEIADAKGDFASHSEGGKQYQGAIVLEPKGVGIWWDVTVADFASLYPSVIKKYNLSYETLRCNHQSCKHNKVPDLPHWVCSQRTGIMSSLTGFVRDVRVRWYKSRAKKDPFADTVQRALKVFINASYGVFGNKNFAFFTAPLAESTTAYSRNALLSSKEEAEKLGLEVLYGDTDSIFIYRMSEEQFTSLKMWSVIQLGIELGIDYNFRFLVMSGRKKNYLGITTKNKLILKGLQVKKRNTAIFIKELFQDVADILIGVQNPDELENAKKTIIEMILQSLKDLKTKNIKLSKLSRIASLNRAFSEYSANTPAIQVAVQTMTKDNIGEIEQGHQFEVVSVNPFGARVRTSEFTQLRKGTILKCAFKEIKKIKSLDEVDLERYEEQMEKAFTPILNAFDMDWNEIVSPTVPLLKYFEEI